MARPNNRRRVGFIPRAIRFKPAGIRAGSLEEVVLGNDEIEAVRLKDLLGMSQGEAAKEMQISQPTFHRLVLTARQKIADALVNGKAVRIEGGNIDLSEDFSQPCHWRKRWGCKVKDACAPAGKKAPAPERSAAIIAVTSTDGTPDGMVDERFGRSRKIVVYDRDSGTFEAVDNTANMNSPQGAGVETARTVSATPAQTVISGHFGPNAFAALDAAGIAVYSASDITVREALTKLEEGTLTRLAGPDVEAHW